MGVGNSREWIDVDGNRGREFSGEGVEKSVRRFLRCGGAVAGLDELFGSPYDYTTEDGKHLCFGRRGTRRN